MLVPKMTLEEIRNSLTNDYKKELKMKIKHVELSRHRKWMERGRQDFKETLVHTTQSKNDWRIAVHYQDGACSIVPYIVSYNHVGITASHFTDPYSTHAMMFFNTHFFKRYRERANIDIEKPEKLVNHFFKKNTTMIPCYKTMPDGTKQLFCPLNGGLGLGYFHEELQVCEFKTFVDNGLLREEQHTEIRLIYERTLAEMEVEWKKRMKRMGAKL